MHHGLCLYISQDLFLSRILKNLYNVLEKGTVKGKSIRLFALDSLIRDHTKRKHNGAKTMINPILQRKKGNKKNTND
ncbi:MAG: hypothetical protein ACTSWY_15655 [Promethearchaeota archaeon]